MAQNKKVVPAFFDDRLAYIDLGEPGSSPVRTVNIDSILKLNKLEPGQFIFVPDGIVSTNKIRKAVEKARELYRNDYRIIYAATHNGVRGTKIQRIDNVFAKSIVKIK